MIEEENTNMATKLHRKIKTVMIKGNYVNSLTNLENRGRKVIGSYKYIMRMGK